jgi:hypothetical protein
MVSLLPLKQYYNTTGTAGKAWKNQKRDLRRKEEWQKKEGKMVEFVRRFYCAICCHFLVFPTRISECGHLFCRRYNENTIQYFIIQSTLCSITHSSNSNNENIIKLNKW